MLVIGGGVTGAGVALDAATRGLRTVLIEAEDLAFGTSRWSSKLVHGGLRYLASGDLRLAHECAVERGNLMRFIAPHLVRPAPMMLALTPAVSRGSAAAYGAGLAAADVLRRVSGTPSLLLPRPRRLDAARARELAPGVPGMRGGLQFHDGQLTDDARLVVAIARTAAGYGASILTRLRATAIGAAGVSVIDGFTGESGTIRGRAVVNATGVRVPQFAPELRLTPSRGTHVVLDEAAVPGLRVNLMTPIPGAHNRYLMVLPQPGGRLYLGLTDEPVDRIEDVPVPPRSDIDQLTGILATVLERDIDPHHVLGAFAGLRPMYGQTPAKTSSDLSRRHHVLVGEHGAIHVVGGKLTTYRHMAQDAVDAAIEHLRLAAGPCLTRRLPLVGAGAAGRSGRPPAPGSLASRYGTEAAVVAEMAARPGLAENVAPGIPVTHAELRFSVRHEGAFTVDDLLDRRFRIGLVPADRDRALPAARAALADGGLPL